MFHQAAAGSRQCSSRKERRQIKLFEIQHRKFRETHLNETVLYKSSASGRCCGFVFLAAV